MLNSSIMSYLVKWSQEPAMLRCLSLGVVVLCASTQTARFHPLGPACARPHPRERAGEPEVE